MKTDFRCQILSQAYGVGEMSLICGGTFAALSYYPEIVGAQVRGELDVANELVARKRAADCVNHHFISLGSGETGHTLSVDAPEPVKRMARMAVGFLMINGAGGKRCMASLGCQKRVRSGQFRALARKFVGELLIALGGVINHVNLRVKAGMAGGVGSDSAYILAEAVVRALHEFTDATIHVYFDLVGPITYEGCGTSIQQNAAAALVGYLDRVTNEVHLPRVTYWLNLWELYPVGQNKGVRDAQLLDFCQAFYCSAVQRHHKMIEPNRSLNGRSGNTTLPRAGLFTPLHPRRQVVPEVATFFVDSVQTILTHAKPQLSLISKNELIGKRTPLPREEISNIVDRVLVSEDGEVLSSIKTLGCKLNVSVLSYLADGEELQLENCRVKYAPPPATTGDTLARLVELISCLAFLERDLARQEQAVLDAEDALSSSEKKVWRALGWLRPKMLLFRWMSQLSSLARRLLVFERAAEACREAHDRYYELLTELLAMRRAREALREEMRQHNEILLGILDGLKAFIPRGKSKQSQALIEPRPIDELWERLWAIDRLDSDGRLRLLCSGVKRVTVYGLAAITDADPTRLETIAHRLVNGEATIDCPPWGGRDGRDAIAKFIVLPPMEQMAFEQIKTLVEKLDPTLQVVTSDYANASVNAVRLRIETVERLDELFTGNIQRSLVEALREPEVYFPRGTDCVTNLGISVNGKVMFPGGEEVHHGPCT